MRKYQKTRGFILTSTYFLVLLHSVVPHFHGENDCVLKEVNHPHSFNHHHDHHNSLDHKHDSEESILHALGHLFNGLHHLDMGEEHLTYVNAQMINFEPSILLVAIEANNYFDVFSDLMKNQNSNNFTVYSAPPLEQFREIILPSRAPPALA